MNNLTRSHLFNFCFSTLKHLYLFDACKNIKCMQELEDVLPNLKSLTHLDISKEFDPEGIIYATDPYITADLLGKIATLPNLLHLDISGNKFYRMSRYLCSLLTHLHLLEEAI